MEQLEVWGHWEARSGQGVEAGVKSWAFAPSEWEPLQGPEGGQLWADCVHQSETAPT